MPNEWKTISSDHVINVVYTYFLHEIFLRSISDNYSKKNDHINEEWNKCLRTIIMFDFTLNSWLSVTAYRNI